MPGDGPVTEGAPRIPGSSRMEGECVSICSGGSSLAARSDNLQFDYREVTGDFVFSNRHTGSFNIILKVRFHRGSK